MEHSIIFYTSANVSEGPATSFICIGVKSRVLKQHGVISLDKLQSWPIPPRKLLFLFMARILHHE